MFLCYILIQMPTETLLETIDKQVEKLTKSIQDDSPLHLRDERMVPTDGIDNYMTIAEAQVLGAIRQDKLDAIEQLKRLKLYVTAQGLK